MIVGADPCVCPDCFVGRHMGLPLPPAPSLSSASAYALAPAPHLPRRASSLGRFANRPYALAPAPHLPRRPASSRPAAAARLPRSCWRESGLGWEKTSARQKLTAPHL